MVAKVDEMLNSKIRSRIFEELRIISGFIINP